jgi:hypothetical protein
MPDFNLPQRHLVLLFMLALSLIACSSAKPPDDLFQDDIEKMVLLDRELGFREEISEIKVLKRQASDERVEVVPSGSEDRRYPPHRERVKAGLGDLEIFLPKDRQGVEDRGEIQSGRRILNFTF